MTDWSIVPFFKKNKCVLERLLRLNSALATGVLTIFSETGTDFFKSHEWQEQSGAVPRGAVSCWTAIKSFKHQIEQQTGRGASSESQPSSHTSNRHFISFTARDITLLIKLHWLIQSMAFEPHLRYVILEISVTVLLKSYYRVITAELLPKIWKRQYTGGCKEWGITIPQYYNTEQHLSTKALKLQWLQTNNDTVAPFVHPKLIFSCLRWGTMIPEGILQERLSFGKSVSWNGNVRRRVSEGEGQTVGSCSCFNQAELNHNVKILPSTGLSHSFIHSFIESFSFQSMLEWVTICHSVVTNIVGILQDQVYTL